MFHFGVGLGLLSCSVVSRTKDDSSEEMEMGSLFGGGGLSEEVRVKNDAGGDELMGERPARE